MKKIIKLLLFPVAIFAAADQKDIRPRLFDYPPEILEKMLSYAGEIKSLGQSHPGTLEKLNKYAVGHEASAVDKWTRFKDYISEYDLKDRKIILSPSGSKFVELTPDNKTIIITSTNPGIEDGKLVMGQTLANVDIIKMLEEGVEAVTRDFNDFVSGESKLDVDLGTPFFSGNELILLVKFKFGAQNKWMEYFLDLNPLNSNEEISIKKIKLNNIPNVPSQLLMSQDKKKFAIFPMPYTGDGIKIYDISGNIIKTVNLPYTNILITDSKLWLIDANNSLVKIIDIYKDESKDLDVAYFKSLMPGKRFNNIRTLGEKGVIVNFTNAESVYLDKENLEKPVILEGSFEFGSKRYGYYDNFAYAIDGMKLKIWSLKDGKLIKYFNIHHMDNMLDRVDIMNIRLSRDLTLLSIFYYDQSRLWFAVIDIDNERLIKKFNLDSSYAQDITADQNTILVKASNSMKIFSISEAIENSKIKEESKMQGIESIE